MTFITFEGMDGAGKTSTSAQVAQRLNCLGYNVQYVDKKDISIDEGYLTHHAESIRNLIWGYPAEAPISGLGDGHWVHLMASWFHLLDETVVRPALGNGKLVIVDSWMGKFVARFSVKSSGRSQQARAAFGGLSKPDMTVFLDVSPLVAAARKRNFTAAECGNLDGYSGTNAANFIAYQSRIREALSAFGAEWGWERIDTTGLTEEQVVARAAELIQGRFRLAAHLVAPAAR